MTADPKLLVVEDDPAVRALLVAYLEKDGFRVHGASNASDAEKALQGDDYAMVLLDLGLPDEDGTVLAKKLRARSSVPIVFVTERAGDEDRVTALEMGGDDYITKPFNPRELSARIRNILKRAGTQSHPGTIAEDISGQDVAKRALEESKRNRPGVPPTKSDRSPTTQRKIFISYRREDSAGHAGRVNDRLVAEFGRDVLFMDVDAIPLGSNFVRVLEDAVAKCDLLLAIMGPNWLEIADERGCRRIDDPADYVRVEIGAALKRDIPVIPILLEGTRVPRIEQLPEELKELSLRNGLDVRHGSFHQDIERLLRFLHDKWSA